MNRKIRIATRRSQLALWQAEHVSSLLQAAHPGLEVELVAMVSRGDRLLDAPLAKIGGKGLFVKELEQALLEDHADIAVHSVKDVPMEFPTGLGVHCICQREDPFDAFVSNRYPSFEQLPTGAVLGTSSLRRQAQLLALRPDLQVRFLRGNVGTRLERLDAGGYDAIVLASAGLKRLGLAHRIRTLLAPQHCLPAVGQGAIGIECRSDDSELLQLLQPLQHQPSALRVTAERAMSQRLNGGCQVPIAGFAELTEDHLQLRGLVGRPDGRLLLRAEASAPPGQAQRLGVEVAELLLGQGAQAVLDELMAEARR